MNVSEHAPHIFALCARCQKPLLNTDPIELVWWGTSPDRVLPVCDQGWIDGCGR